MKSVIITGAYGFLGRNTALKFKEYGYKVFGCGHGCWDGREYEQWGIDEWIQGDISLDLLQKFNVHPDVIIHCAGSGTVGLSLSNPTSDFHKTVSGTLDVLEFIRINSPKTKFVYPSSAAVYGEHIDSEISTHDSLNPASPYGVHKKIAEEICTSYRNHFGITTAIIRFFSIYGPGLKKQLLWDACNKLTKKTDTTEFWGTGHETRDWIYITDATELIYLNATSAQVFSIMNGGTGKKISIKETLLILSKELNTELTTIGFNNVVRIGDPRFYHASMNEAIQFNWSAKVSLEDGLQKYADWFRTLQND